MASRRPQAVQAMNHAALPERPARNLEARLAAEDYAVICIPVVLVTAECRRNTSSSSKYHMYVSYIEQYQDCTL